MDNAAEISAVPEKRLATDTFYGYARHKRIPDGYFSDDRNMTSDEYPCACVRPPRTLVRNFGVIGSEKAELNRVPFERCKIIDAISVDGNIAYITDRKGYRDGNITEYKVHVFFKDHHWDLAGADIDEDGRLLAFGNGLFCVQSGHYIPNRQTSGSGTIDTSVIRTRVKLTGIFSAYPDDMDGNLVKPTLFVPAAADAPDTPADGDWYYNTTSSKLYKAVSGAWAEKSPADGFTFFDKTNSKLYKELSGAWAEQTPANGDHLYDEKSDALYIYSSDIWQPMAIYSTWLSIDGLDNFEALAGLVTGDGISVKYNDETTETVIQTAKAEWWLDDSDVPQLNVTLHILVRGHMKTTDGSTMTVERRYPQLQHAVVHDNRIFGCQYVEQQEGPINEICVCKLGDPLAWYSDQGLSDDSFTFTVGEPGEWTGAAILEDRPVFFKEHCMVTVYGDSASNYTSATTLLDGVQEGSARSLCNINGSLYYHSRRGVMRLSEGGYPVCISDALRRKNIWEDAVAGTDGRKYYIEMYDKADRVRKLYVYDTETGIWHIEDNAGDGFLCFARLNSELLAVSNVTPDSDENGTAVALTYVSSPDWDNPGFLNAYLAGKVGDTFKAPWDAGYPVPVLEVEQQPYTWQFATNDFGHVDSYKKGADAVDYKRVKEIDIRYWKEAGAQFTAYIQYDRETDETGADKWEALTRSAMTGPAGTSRVKYRLRRCDLYRLKFAGEGIVCIYSITHTYEEAGDRAYGQ